MVRKLGVLLIMGAIALQMVLAVQALAIVPLGTVPDTRLDGDGRNGNPGSATGIALDAQGRLVEADRYWRAIHLVPHDASADEARVQFGEGWFGEIGDIATSPSGTVYAADTQNDLIVSFTEEGQVIGTFGGGVIGDPSGLAVGPDGTVYVTDSKLNRVEAFSAEGVFERFIGSPGEGSGELEEPDDAAIGTSGPLYVTDPGNHRIDAFSPATGNFIGAFGLEVDPSGANFCTADCQPGEVGGAAGALGRPSSAAVAPDGRLWVKDYGAERVDAYEFGQFIEGFGTGVVDGSVEFQVCTFETGCQKAVAANGEETVTTATAEGIGPLAVDCHGTLYAGQTVMPDPFVGNFWLEGVIRFGEPDAPPPCVTKSPATSTPTAPSTPTPTAGRVTVKRLHLNPKAGAGSVVVAVSGAGSVTLQGDGVRRATKVATIAGTVSLPLRAGGAKLRGLRRAGKVTVRAKVVFHPSDGGAEASLVKQVKLRRHP
jgi:sugar lactone lactonase YvrE